MLMPDVGDDELLQINIFRSDVIYHTIAFLITDGEFVVTSCILRNINHNLIRKNKVINMFFNK